MGKFKLSSKIEFHIKTPQFHDITCGRIVFVPNDFDVVVRWANGNESKVEQNNTGLVLKK